ncbi:MAG: TolC family protein [Acidobacteriota bacterium]|nr:TolC family protein [Blastocatellia bacterium]MDW8412696.1 TolC family protein [Acidobacteriota bacterium]
MVRRVLLVLVGLATWSYGQQVLTPEEAVRRVLERSPAMNAVLAAQSAARAEVSLASALRLPQLQLAESFAYSNNPVFVFGSLLEQRRFTMANFSLRSLNSPDPLVNFRTAVTLRMPLFDQLQSRTALKRSRLGLEQAGAELERVAEKLRFETLKAYYGLVLAESRLKVSEEAVESAAADVQRARDLFDSGLVVEADLLAAQTLLAEFEQQRIEAEGNYISALAALNMLLDLPLQTKQVLGGRLIERIFPELSQEQLEELARNRADYRQAEYSVSIAEQSIREAQAQNLPRIEFFGTFGNSAEKLVGGSSDFTVGVNISFSIYDPARKARQLKAQALYEQSTAMLKNKWQQINLEIVTAYQSYISAKQRQRVASESLAKAREVLRVVRDRYEAGLTTMTELLRAQTALLRAELSVLDARYDYYIGYARLRQASGTLSNVADFR